MPRAVYDKIQKELPNVPMYEMEDGLVKIPAGWLIEKAGCRERSVGDAGVYPQQCLVLVNRGHASSNDIIQLSRIIIETVQERFGITLEPEVNFI